MPIYSLYNVIITDSHFCRFNSGNINNLSKTLITLTIPLNTHYYVILYHIFIATSTIIYI